MHVGFTVQNAHSRTHHWLVEDRSFDRRRICIQRANATISWPASRAILRNSEPTPPLTPSRPTFMILLPMLPDVPEILPERGY